MHPPEWNFSLARNFLREFHSGSQLIVDPSIPDVSLYDPKISLPQHLGDFDRLYEFCGKPIPLPPPKVRQDSSGSSSTELASTCSSPAAENSNDGDEQQPCDVFTSKTPKEVRWEDEIAASPRRRRKQSPGAGLNAAVVSQLVEGDLDHEGVNEIGTPTRCSRKQVERHGAVRIPQIHVHHPPPKALYDPRRNILVSLSNTCTPVDRSIIQPQYTLTENEQKAKIIKKLIHQYGRQEPDLKKNATLLISHPGGNNSPNGIHVFVDCSNIVIGCTDQLKARRRIHHYVKQPPISFYSLALILERGRPTARRVLVGSQMSVAYGSPAKSPSHFDEARKSGYEMNILERVQKPQTPTMIRKKKGGTGSGYATSGQSSASESVPSRLAMAEQGVDEILQMKMLETLVDFQEPSTIVLASGDGAEAEYSGGFLKSVERALEKGWKVELVAWTRGLSKEYTSPKFLKKWKDSFKIIPLDDFCEEMLAVYSEKYHLLPVFPVPPRY